MAPAKQAKSSKTVSAKAPKAAPAASLLARRLREVQASATLAITAKANQMKADGIDVVSFAAGEPDFDTPAPVSQAGCDAIKAGRTRYTPSSGTPTLRAAVCKKFKADNGLEYAPAEVLISCGAKHSIFNLIMTLCGPGDEVIIPGPYWVSYPEMVKLAEAKAVILPTTEATGFKVTARQLAKALTPKTKLFILNSPSNPTGMVYTPAELEALAEVLLRKKVWCLSDEIYEKLLYDGVKHVSIAAVSEKMKALTLVVNGHSKAYAMTGWRIGYAAGPKALIVAAGNLQSHSTSNPATMCQDAAEKALLGDQGVVETMRREFEKRRDLIVTRLNAIPGIRCLKPQGAFYVFPNVSGLYGKSYGGQPVNGSMDFGRVFLEQARVASVPGCEFGADECVRLSYACSTERIIEGMNRIERLVATAG